jgi:WD40-like Beta Propeller Repeat
VTPLFDGIPADAEAEERAWQVVSAAFEAREVRPRARRLRAAPAVGLVVLAAAVAALLSPPGRAVVDAVRRSIGIENAQPALLELPSPGRLLVSGAGGAWVVQPDGATRRIGPYAQASWSPHALYVVGATGDELAAVQPANGQVRWQLARPSILFPRWGGTLTDTRIAYLTTGRLHVVAGDGTGDRPLPRAAHVAPAWEPGASGHVLAYVAAGDRVVVVDADRGTVAWRSRPYADPRSLAWSADGRSLALATRTEVVVFDGATGHARLVAATGVRALAFSSDGRLALLRGDGVLLWSEGRLRTLFVAPGRLDGIAWSPDGRWLLSSLPVADQWVFVQTRGARRVLAVSHIGRRFGGEPTLDGWMR